MSFGKSEECGGRSRGSDDGAADGDGGHDGATGLSSASGAAGGLGGLMSSATSMLPSIAGGAVGILGAAGLQAQSGVVTPSNPLADACTALAGSGASLGSAVGSLFGLPGMLNVSVATLRTDSIGIAHAYQVGVSQAVNIGVAKNESVWQASALSVGQQYNIAVGRTMTIDVGDTLAITVGQSSLTLDKDGNVTLSGKTFVCSFSDHIQLLSKLIDLN